MALITPFFMLVFMTLRILVTVTFQVVRLMVMLAMAAGGVRRPRIVPSVRTLRRL